MNTKEEVILENSRVRMSPLSITHLDDLLPIALNHPKLLKYSPSAFGTKESLSAYIQSAINQRNSGNRYPFVIFDKQRNAFVGSSSFGNISSENKRIEIGWTWLDPIVHGTGLNKYVKHLMLTYAFDTLDFQRVELKADARNIQSRRAMEKIGATYEGTLRSHTLMQDGHRRDTVYYSILKNEWQLIVQKL
ncbi:GNAT family N-acetyltransferase [Portibacter lacus]|uniref:GCN5 family acetyltransferase n=1 Tax=Portibacter lacus TaxID=1099794 RepID=A0AA37SRI9_9BACT|nr:GNAT family protein [Portibacter lacus]GLR18577.1 GCN5 family acetyltransferase [Portibacter lacus]